MIDTSKTINRTGEILVQMGVITAAQLDITITQQRTLLAENKRVHIGELLVRNQFARRDQVAMAVEKVTGGGKVASYQTLLAPAVCDRYQVVPVRTENGLLFVMTARPLRTRELAAIMAACLVPVLGVKHIATSKQALADHLRQIATSETGFTLALQKLRQTDTGASLRDCVHTLLQEALDVRASDIHIDRKPSPDAWVSYRIDGELRQRHLLTPKIMGAIVTRIKTDAGMDASNSISAQDGRISLEHQGRIVDFRVNSQPIVDGETLALRVLDSDALPTVEQMFPNQLAMTEIFGALANSNGKRGGIFLATGPTGSGKTTTLYALAKQLSRDTKNVMTVEDPVEYRLPFARQIQLNQMLGQAAGDFERSLLRQDPDIIILGEIRTADTASAALKFSESGHMVFATLHADSVESVFERIAGFFEGAAKDEALFVLGQQLRCVINQQLVPKLCTCAVPISRDEQNVEAERLNLFLLSPTKTRCGCHRCGNGVFGRALAHETVIFPRDRAVRSEIHAILRASISRANEILDIKNVTHISRHDVVTRLLEAGSIDLLEASNILAN